MTMLDRAQKRSAIGGIALGMSIAIVGALIAASAYTHLGDKPHVMAQAAPDATKSSPAEPVRPTTPAPEPARPNADAQKAGAEPALPPAPAEKVGEPVPERK